MSTITLTAQQLDEKPPVDMSMLSDQDKKELVIADTESVVSGITIDGAEAAFTAARSYHIHAKGVPVLRLPAPPSELVTTVSNLDGSIAYQSTRERRSSGNCVLTDAEGHPSIATQYFFGPGKDPVLRRVDVEDGEDNVIKTVSKWTSRAQKFLLRDGRTFDWEYKKEKGFGGQGTKGTALVLTMNGRRIAALIRNEETRTPGSKSCSAGNGGELVLGQEVGGKEGISEELVIATVLLMLKKEIDRRRTVQFMMIAAAVSG
ncbi:uncharacterized protein CC84DRAFT_1223526 [Paraphaeosphaeria sporulosa]|uniref:Uncharacterized protein n=1 Tax=Paraphaeosphaeria sporulosa TaxID=1460663 RepID=A0A177BUY0_9PLEO|nr:uncharacterized protein CC84DRAFT_1223526 [Paraphaeosphaeria sporulosa]OAF98780.1 hypothetical protein CC84DRAFT_1223526 [Paraphaeosphaeria sporulosa]